MASFTFNLTSESIVRDSLSIINIVQSLIQLLISISIVLLLIFLIIYLCRNHNNFFHRNWEPVQVNLSIPSLGNITIKPNIETIKIAHEAHIEIMTRKIGLQFDKENDVIVEVYNSWYEFFKIIRELTKKIPPNKIREDEDSQKLQLVLFAVLNDCLRPHLTIYQAKFRRWYDNELISNPNLSPQEIQKRFQEYSQLVQHISEVNGKMIQLNIILCNIAYGRSV